MPETSPATHGVMGSIWRYTLAGLISLIAWATVVITMAEANIEHAGFFAWVFLGDLGLGLVSYILMRQRHRWPGPVAIFTTLASFFSTASTGPAVWMIGSLTMRHRWRLLAVVFPLNIVATIVQERFYPGQDDLPVWVSFLVGSLILGLVMAIGYAMGSQRDLMVSLHDRAETVEREQQARIARAQAGERTRIAREMHDVLAHRISLVAMHAGALSYRTDLTPEEQATAARTIEENAHQALRDLRDVLGVLRDPMTPVDAAAELPQPVLADIPALVEEGRASGMRINLDQNVDGAVPDGLGRTAYRIVQEALTNARKHAPGTTVDVTLAGNREGGLTVRVHNARPVGPETAGLPDSGLGLLGLDERVALTGGRFRHGRHERGGYVVEAWLPWTL